MRQAILMGLLVCGLVFVTNTESTSALPLEKLQNQNNETSVELLLAVAEEDATESEIVAEKEPEPVPVEHKVAKNESLSEIAKIHDTTWKRIYDKNEKIENPDIVNPGEVVVIPADDEELAAREVPVAPVVTTTASVRITQPRTKNSSSPARSGSARSVSTPRGSASGNRYTAGYCTWYVKSLRADLPNNLGNAATWVSRAAAQGIPTGSAPRVGAVAQRNNHVAYVSSVNADGTMNITEMNYRGLYQVTNRTVPANQWSFVY